MSSQDVSEQVATLAQEIRELKTSLKSQGVAKEAINRHEGVLSKVQALQTLKSQLCSDDPARDEAILARLQEERQERQRQEQASASAQREQLKLAETAAPQPLIQRKIFHLFCHAGNGDKFHYEPPPRLNSADCSFGEGPEPHPAVYVTEKWDGTTMQATSTHIFARLDVRGKRKNATDPRYALRLVAWRGEDGSWNGLDHIDADIRVREAISPYLQHIEQLDHGLCVYFEVVHTDINTAFKQLPGLADIRVFDFSRTSSSFLPFEVTIQLSEQLGLPLVGWERREKLDVASVWQELAAAKQGRHYATAAAQLEGFVVREAGAGGRIAKARVEHVSLLEAAPAGSPTGSCVAQIDRQGQSLAHLAAIGLFDLKLPPAWAR